MSVCACVCVCLVREKSKLGGCLLSGLQNKRNRTPQAPPWSQGFLFQLPAENISGGRLSCKDRNMLLLLSDGRREQQDAATFILPSRTSWRPKPNCGTKPQLVFITTITQEVMVNPSSSMECFES